MPSIIARETHKLFGRLGPTTDFAEFGSLVAAAPLKTKDIATIQALPAWDDGWQESIFGANKDLLLQDLNGWCFEHSYQVAYIFQWGIPEYDASTEYETGSVVQGKKGAANAGQWFASLQDGNLGNTPPTSADNAFWRWANRPLPSSFGFNNALKALNVLRPNAGAPTTKVDFTADLLSVQGVSLSNVAVTVDKTVVGLNGLDSGVIIANQKYAYHVICSADGSLVGGVISLSATAPTLPAGYTKFRRAGWVFTSAGSLIVQFFQQGDWWWWTDATQFSFAVVNGTMSFAAAVPPTSRLVAFTTYLQSGVGSAAQLLMKVTGTAMPSTPVVATFNSGNSINEENMTFQFPTNANQQIDIVKTATVGPLIVLGYYDPI